VRFTEIYLELHLHIAHSTRFPRLYRLIQNSNIEKTAIFGVVMKAQGTELEDHETNVNLHQALVEALLGQDPAVARAEIWRHLDTALKLITKFCNAPQPSHLCLSQ
jgi:DNA-binding FadR family transcriptional regulator